MKKLLRIIISTLLTMSSVGLMALAIPLVNPQINWALLIPVALFAFALLFAAWQVITGSTWRDIFDFFNDISGRY
jgi:hypothetical protein